MKGGNKFWLILIWEYIIPKLFAVYKVDPFLSEETNGWDESVDLPCEINLVYSVETHALQRHNT